MRAGCESPPDPAAMARSLLKVLHAIDYLQDPHAMTLADVQQHLLNAAKTLGSLWAETERTRKTSPSD
ncbi:hypothetical protein [Sorlinia euscelidii]|uniref:hypothetical protein n=2 Tax=Sorlinia euscelidii TaxID=3081148 RepID=UPI003AAC4369